MHRRILRSRGEMWDRLCGVRCTREVGPAAPSAPPTDGSGETFWALREFMLSVDAQTVRESMWRGGHHERSSETCFHPDRAGACTAGYSGCRRKRDRAPRRCPSGRGYVMRRYLLIRINTLASAACGDTCLDYVAVATHPYRLHTPPEGQRETSGRDRLLAW